MHDDAGEFNAAFNTETVAIAKRMCKGTKFYLRQLRGGFQLFDDRVFVCAVSEDAIRKIDSVMLQNPHLDVRQAIDFLEDISR